MVAGILSRVAAYFGMTVPTQPPYNGYEPRFRKVCDTEDETLWALVDLANDCVFLATGPSGGNPEKVVETLVVSEIMQGSNQPMFAIKSMRLCPREELSWDR